ncbi:hypothetical protein R5R35_006301 [Gryllus longicercus]|uniref:Small ribosomal subunit protein mS39 n=1 Tax=Gryllus longicercus TaxID=2509291 RepID=A0AAN9W1H5_9ORTH
MMSSLRSTTFRSCAQRSFQLYVNLVRQSSTESAKEIKIPRRIKRGPTDVLKALAATVTRDTTAPHYKYQDDPFLTPSSNVGKRTFAMAKESGKKAARWVQNQHPELFQHKVSFPFIENYTPITVYDENSAVDENTLKRVIYYAQVSDAIKVYELLEQKGINVSGSTKQSFLEMLCFFNCEDPLPEEFLEERWFHLSTKGREKLRKTWKDNSLAEKIFLSFEQKDSKAYSAIIQGMTRYCQAERAWKLYEECLEKNIILHTETYNSLIRVVHFLKEGFEHRWKLVQELLEEMAKKNIHPNVGTLNAVLEAVSTLPNQRQSKEYALRTLSEFKALNIQPTLASYYFLLITFCKQRGPISNILVEIMDTIQGQEFSVQDPKDTYFFVTAMDVCRNHLQDKDLAYRVDELLHTGNNYILIGDSYKESIYYRHFFVLMCTLESLDVFMDLYRKIVPHIYTPEPAVMEEVIKTIDMNGAMEYVPQIWSDMVVFDHVERENVVTTLLDSMARNKLPEESELISQFGNIAWDIWKRQEEDVEEDRYRQWRWTGQILGDMMTLLLRANQFKESCIILDKLNRSQQNIVGVPRVEVLQLFLDRCIQEKDVKAAIGCVQYSADAGFSDAEQMAQKLINNISLDEGILARLSNIIGKNLSKID